MVTISDCKMQSMRVNINYRICCGVFLYGGNMNKTTFNSLFLMSFLVVLVCVGGKQSLASGASLWDAKAHALKAANFVREYGKMKALAQFNSQDSRFVQDDLYVVVFDSKGVIKSEPVNPLFVGKSIKYLHDTRGEYVFDKVKSLQSDGGWTEYKWLHPQSGEVLRKNSFVVKVDDLYVSVGSYDQDINIACMAKEEEYSF